MNKAAFVDSLAPRESESDVHKIHRLAESQPSVNVVDLASAIAAPTRRVEVAPCVERAASALEHATLGNTKRAQRDADDALIMIVALTYGRREGDRGLAALAALTAGDAFLLLDDPESARECFEIAVRFFDTRHDLIRAAQAECGLAEAHARLQAGTLDDVPDEP